MQAVLHRQPAPKGWDQPMPLRSGASETAPGVLGQTGKNEALSPPFPQDCGGTLVPVPFWPSVCAGTVRKLTRN